MVTHYIGTGTAGGAYVTPVAQDPPTVTVKQSDHNAYDYPDRDTDNPKVKIKMAQGMFYPAAAIDADGTVAEDAKGTNLYYYDKPADNADDPDVRTWLLRTKTETANDGTGTVSQVYNTIVMANVVEKLADFPMVAAFKHLHYGLWNGLSGSAGNMIADLGIGLSTPRLTAAA